MKSNGPHNNSSAHRKAEGNNEDDKSNNRRIATQTNISAPLDPIFVKLNTIPYTVFKPLNFFYLYKKIELKSKYIYIYIY